MNPAAIITAFAASIAGSTPVYWLAAPASPAPTPPFLVVAPMEIGRLVRFVGGNPTWSAEVSWRYVYAPPGQTDAPWASLRAAILGVHSQSGWEITVREIAPLPTSPYGAQSPNGAALSMVGMRTRIAIEQTA